MRLDPITLMSLDITDESNAICPVAPQATSGDAIKSADSSQDSTNWLAALERAQQQVMPDDHSEVVPLLPIPNRTVKRLCADDSADSRVKVGHRQAITASEGPAVLPGLLLLGVQCAANCVRRQDCFKAKTLSQFARPASIDGTWLQVFANCFLSAVTTFCRAGSLRCHFMSSAAIRCKDR